MALTGRQIRQLRSLAHHLEPVITVGKQGVAPAVVDQANAALEAHELIKCSAPGELRSLRPRGRRPAC